MPLLPAPDPLSPPTAFLNFHSHLRQQPSSSPIHTTYTIVAITTISEQRRPNPLDDHLLIFTALFLTYVSLCLLTPRNLSRRQRCQQT